MWFKEKKKWTNLYPRLSKNEILPRVLKHRGNSFFTCFIPLVLSLHASLVNTGSKKKGQKCLETVALSWSRLRRSQAFPTWLPSQCCIRLSWGFHCPHQNKQASKWVLWISSVKFMLHYTGSPRRKGKEHWLLSPELLFVFIWLCSKGGKPSHWVYHLSPSEWPANLDSLVSKDRLSKESLFSFCQIFPQIQRSWQNSLLLQRLSHWHCHFIGNFFEWRQSSLLGKYKLSCHRTWEILTDLRPEWLLKAFVPCHLVSLWYMALLVYGIT